MPGELSEKDFINNGYKKNPWPTWIVFFILIGLLAIGWFSSEWRERRIQQDQEQSPFLQVTNRQMSLFLWSNPEFMRANARIKADYLPAFQENNNTQVIPAFAEEYVSAPPEVLFRYHIWDEYLSEDVPNRKITIGEFIQFLKMCEEWSPPYWSRAPEEYRSFVNQLTDADKKSEIEVPKDILPKVVRQAFIGWKNFFKEGEEINAVSPTYAQIKAFLITHPHLGRSYWRNILMESTPGYLLVFSEGDYDPDAVVAPNEISSVFKVPYYNSVKANDKD